ncbi:MAG: hypothetical protein IT304_00540, partial [Dehalococcoidia bacterium]|nr:hypothetical protein [Dehalococcoidia bacterium]
ELERGTRAIVMTELASLTGRQGRLEDAYAWREHAFRLYEETDNKIGALMQIVHLAANARERGETALLESWVEAYVEAQLELGEPQAAAPALEELVTLALDCDDQSLAEARAHRALALYEKLGDEGGGARELTNLSALAAKRKDFGAAEQLATEALAVDTRLEAPEQITDLLRRLRTVSELHRRAKG